jgi:hypothetical protein
VTDDADTRRGPASGTARPTPPPDPAEYDSDRARIARAKGLEAPYIAGGRDPDPEPGLREERFYGRLLLAMVITVVLAGFVLGIVLALLTGAPPR